MNINRPAFDFALVQFREINATAPVEIEEVGSVVQAEDGKNYIFQPHQNVRCFMGVPYAPFPWIDDGGRECEIVVQEGRVFSYGRDVLIEVNIISVTCGDEVSVSLLFD